MSNKLKFTQISSFLLLAFTFVIFGCKTKVEYGDDLDSVKTDYEEHKANFQEKLAAQQEEFSALTDGTASSSTIEKFDIDDFAVNWKNLENEYSYLLEDLAKFDTTFRQAVRASIKIANDIDRDDIRSAKLRKIQAAELLFDRRMIEHKKQTASMAKLLSSGQDYIKAFEIDKTLAGAGVNIKNLDVLFEGSQKLLSSLSKLSEEGEKIALTDTFEIEDF